MNHSEPGCGSPSPTPGRVLLSKNAIRVLAKMDPDSMFRSLNRSLGFSKSEASTQEVIDLIDSSGISRLVFAVAGTIKTAQRLGIDPDLRSRLIKADPYLLPDGALHLAKALKICGLANVEINGVAEVEGDIDAGNSALVTFPDLLKVDGSVNLSNSRSFSAPKLEIIGGELNCLSCNDVNLPGLREVEGLVSVDTVTSTNFPVLVKVGGVDLYFSRTSSFPAREPLEADDLYVYFFNRLGAKIVGPFPELAKVSESINLLFPNLDLLPGNITLQRSLGKWLAQFIQA